MSYLCLFVGGYMSYLCLFVGGYMSYLCLFVGGYMSYLCLFVGGYMSYFCLFAHSGVKHIVLCFCFVFLRLVYHMLPVSLDCRCLMPLRYSLTLTQNVKHIKLC
jgi:hypothetical protein